MRIFTVSSLAFSILLTVFSSTAEAQTEELASDHESRGWLPDACASVMDTGFAASVDGVGEGDEARWNYFYRLGIEAIETKDLEAAEISFCHALDAAAGFGPRDIRFAETLDELGLVRFLGGDYNGSEAMQGAAVAEMLLALGPPEDNVCEAAAKSCRSSVATYLVRLGWIYERQGRGGEIDASLKLPYRILERGYVPEGSLHARLDWLIGRYLLREDFAAADWLTSLRDEDR